MLNHKHFSGKLEKKTIEDIQRSQMGIKVQNCLSLSIVAARRCVANAVAAFAHFPKDPNATTEESNVVAPLVLLDKVLTEAQVNSNDLLKLNADTLIHASAERRRLWVESSSLSKDQQAQICALPIPLPPSDPTQSFDLIGPEGRDKLKAWFASDYQKSQMDLTRQSMNLHYNQSRNQNYKNPNPNYKKKPNTNSQSQSNTPQSNQPFRRDDQGAKGKPNPGPKKPFRGGYRQNRGGKK
jgi:hypothetical protein